MPRGDTVHHGADFGRGDRGSVWIMRQTSSSVYRSPQFFAVVCIVWETLSGQSTTIFNNNNLLDKQKGMLCPF